MFHEDHARDAHQPTLELFRAAQRREPLVRAHERLLGAFVGRRVVAEQIAQKPAHAWCLPIEDHAKCPPVARPRARQQLLFGMRLAAGHFER